VLWKMDFIELLFPDAININAKNIVLSVGSIPFRLCSGLHIVSMWLGNPCSVRQWPLFLLTLFDTFGYFKILTVF